MTTLRFVQAKLPPEHDETEDRKVQEQQAAVKLN
jgi:hypothetical protein